MGIVCLPLAIHDSPEAVGRQSVEWNSELLTNLAPSSIRADQVFRTNSLLLGGANILQSRSDWVCGSIRRRLHMESVNYGASLNHNLMT